MLITPNAIKIALSAFAVVAVLSACNDKKSDYTCVCTARSGTAGTDSTYSLGEISKNDAYAKCASYNSSLDTCYMIVIGKN